MLATERTAYAESDAEIAEALEDPAVGDVALFEGGVFAEFLRQRGFLLPDDERALAEQWLFVKRSVFDVTAVRRGDGLTVRDLCTGEVHEVREQIGSQSLRAGHLICARVIPAGSIWRILGGIEPVALHDRDALLALLDAGPEPGDLMAFFTRRYAPPTLVTGEGDPLVVAEAVLRVTDPLVVAVELNDSFTRVQDNEPPQWQVTETANVGERVRQPAVERQ